MKIVSGPNVNFYAATAFFTYMSYACGSCKPILGWIAFCLLMIPISIWLHGWNQRQDQQMLRDFPLDPFIQDKYGSGSK